MTLQLLHVGLLTDVQVSPILGCGPSSPSSGENEETPQSGGSAKPGGVLNRYGPSRVALRVQPGDICICICVGSCYCECFINVHRQSKRHPVHSDFSTHKSINMTEKYEHSPDLEAQHMDGAPLNRTNTAITLSNEQYERLFFQPSAPRAGDAAKRFGKAPEVYGDCVSRSNSPLKPTRVYSVCSVSSFLSPRPSSPYASSKAPSRRTPLSVSPPTTTSSDVSPW